MRRTSIHPPRFVSSARSHRFSVVLRCELGRCWLPTASDIGTGTACHVVFNSFNLWMYT
ncbi:hypothetical protein X962_5832 [Burkholderia pseudomallei MSHR7343]|nr:hypothetical protein X962_5832 [Burkholderia pseudomallei MSHR7343]